MRTVAYVFIVLVIWGALVEVEKDFGLVPLGTLMIAIVFVATLLIRALIHRSHHNRFLSTWALRICGASLVMIAGVEVVCRWHGRHELQTVISDLKDYQREYGDLPETLAKATNAKSFYGLGLHDFLYMQRDSLSSSNVVVIGYNTPLSQWLYAVSDLNDVDHIFISE